VYLCTNRILQIFRHTRHTKLFSSIKSATFWTTAQQALSGNAAHPCVTGCLDAVVLPIVRWSDREHLFVCKEDKVSGRLQELLKRKLSALHASSAVRVCQLLCTAPLETFQMQILTNNPEHRRPINIRLPWYLTDSAVGLRLVLLTVSTFSSVRALRGLPLPGRLSTVPVSCNFLNRLLWSPYVIGQTIIFLPCSFFFSFLLLLFFPRLISAAVDRMSAILLHMASP